MRPNLKPVIALARSIGSRGQVRSFASNSKEAKPPGRLSYVKWLVTRGATVFVGCDLGQRSFGGNAESFQKTHDERMRDFAKLKEKAALMEKMYEMVSQLKDEDV